jgi:hypothetical protein
MSHPLTRRHALLALPLLAACQAPAPEAAPNAPSPPAAGALGATLTSTLPAHVPLGTALALRYGAAQPGFASLYTIASSGQVMRLFEGRAITPGTLTDFPSRQEPVIRFGAPAGAERFVLVVTRAPLSWLAATDVADATAFPRLNLDAAGFEARLAAALATLPAGTHEVARLTLTTH